MKGIYYVIGTLAFIAILIAISGYASATDRYLDDNNIQTAINSCSDGDTLYVKTGTHTASAAVYWNRSINIIGNDTGAIISHSSYAMTFQGSFNISTLNFTSTSGAAITVNASTTINATNCNFYASTTGLGISAGNTVLLNLSSSTLYAVGAHGVQTGTDSIVNILSSSLAAGGSAKYVVNVGATATVNVGSSNLYAIGTGNSASIYLTTLATVNMINSNASGVNVGAILSGAIGTYYITLNTTNLNSTGSGGSISLTTGSTLMLDAFNCYLSGNTGTVINVPSGVNCNITMNYCNLTSTGNHGLVLGSGSTTNINNSYIKVTGASRYCVSQTASPSPFVSINISNTYMESDSRVISGGNGSVRLNFCTLYGADGVYNDVLTVFRNCTVRATGSTGRCVYASFATIKPTIHVLNSTLNCTIYRAIQMDNTGSGSLIMRNSTILSGTESGSATGYFIFANSANASIAYCNFIGYGSDIRGISFSSQCNLSINFTSINCSRNALTYTGLSSLVNIHNISINSSAAQGLTGTVTDGFVTLVDCNISGATYGWRSVSSNNNTVSTINCNFSSSGGTAISRTSATIGSGYFYNVNATGFTNGVLLNVDNIILNCNFTTVTGTALQVNSLRNNTIRDCLLYASSNSTTAYGFNAANPDGYINISNCNISRIILQDRCTYNISYCNFTSFYSNAQTTGIFYNVNASSSQDTAFEGACRATILNSNYISLYSNWTLSGSCNITIENSTIRAYVSLASTSNPCWFNVTNSTFSGTITVSDYQNVSFRDTTFNNTDNLTTAIYLHDVYLEFINCTIDLQYGNITTIDAHQVVVFSESTIYANSEIQFNYGDTTFDSCNVVGGSAIMVLPSGTCTILNTTIYNPNEPLHLMPFSYAYISQSTIGPGRVHLSNHSQADFIGCSIFNITSEDGTATVIDSTVISIYVDGGLISLYGGCENIYVLEGELRMYTSPTISTNPIMANFPIEWKNYLGTTSYTSTNSSGTATLPWLESCIYNNSGIYCINYTFEAKLNDLAYSNLTIYDTDTEEYMSFGRNTNNTGFKFTGYAHNYILGRESQTTVSIQVNSGISGMAFIGNNTTASDLISGTDIQWIAMWNGNRFIYYFSDGYGTDFMVISGKGYYTKSISNTTLTPPGVNHSLYSVNVNVGLNLIGNYLDIPISTRDIQLNNTVIFWFAIPVENGRFDYYFGPQDDPIIIQPGQIFWANCMRVEVIRL